MIYADCDCVVFVVGQVPGKTREAEANVFLRGILRRGVSPDDGVLPGRGIVGREREVGRRGIILQGTVSYLKARDISVSVLPMPGELHVFDCDFLEAVLHISRGDTRDNLDEAVGVSNLPRVNLPPGDQSFVLEDRPTREGRRRVNGNKS